MSKPLRSRTKKAGMPPGALVTLNGDASQTAKLILCHYDSTSFFERKDAPLKECLTDITDSKMIWINVSGVRDVSTLQELGRHFALHPLLLEDVMSTGQRSKLDDYKDTLYIIAKRLVYSDKNHAVEDEQVSFVLGKNFLITFLESESSVFTPVYDRLRSINSRLRQRGIDYLFYTLLDCLVDYYFLALEKVDQNLENLEDELIEFPSPKTLQQIQLAKRNIAFLRKSVWPMREVISNLRRTDSPLIQDSTKFYIQDVYDHTIQAIDTIESFRDIASGMLDIYLSNISQRMNEIMKVLTIVATIFVPLTFIASVYGMNFDYLPGQHSDYGYYWILGGMTITSAIMLLYFKQKKWL